MDAGYDSYDHERNTLAQTGYHLEVFPGKPYDRPRQIEFARDAVGLFIRDSKIDGELLDTLSSVKAIVRYGVGYDSIDLNAATERGVKVANVQGYCNHAVSDHAMALMFACARAITLAPGRLKSEFTHPPRQDLFEFHDKTLGIIGLGRIGTMFCYKAKNLFKHVLANDPYIADTEFSATGAEKSSLNRLLSESHVISIHCNLSDETSNLLSADAFGKMRQKPILINTARGPVIEEKAFRDALNNDKLHSAGLDVFWDERTLQDLDELMRHPRVITTGHYAWYSTASTVRLQQRATENMLMMLEGHVPEDCLNA